MDSGGCFSDGETDFGGGSGVVRAGSSRSGAPPPPPNNAYNPSASSVVTVAPKTASTATSKDDANIGCGPFKRSGVGGGGGLGSSGDSSDFDEVDSSSIGCFGQISKRQSQSAAAINSMTQSATAIGSSSSSSAKIESSASAKLTKSMTLTSPSKNNANDVDDLLRQAVKNNNNNNGSNNNSPDKNKLAMSSLPDVAKGDDDFLVQASLRALSENREVKSPPPQQQLQKTQITQASLAKSASTAITTSKVEVSLM